MNSLIEKGDEGSVEAYELCRAATILDLRSLVSSDELGCSGEPGSVGVEDKSRHMSKDFTRSAASGDVSLSAAVRVVGGLVDSAFG